MSRHAGAAAEAAPCEPATRLVQAIAGWWAGTFMALLGLAAAVIGLRRLMEAASAPLGPAALAAAGLAAAGGVALVRTSPWWRRRTVGHAGLGRVVALVPTAILLLLDAALTLPGTTVAGIAALWLPAVVEEALAAWRWRRRCGPPAGDVVRPAAATPSLRLVGGIGQREDEPAGQPTQQQTRLLGEDGCERIDGWLSVALAAGQRTATAHLAFCPPLGTLPEFQAAQTNGPEARIKVAQVLPFGARLDVKLSEAPRSATRVVVEFSAWEPPASPVAARAADDLP